MLIQGSIAAATAVVGYDLLQSETARTSTRVRRLVAMALTGSAAALDTVCRLMVGNLEVATIYNAAAGAPTRDHMYRIGVLVPAGAEVYLKVVDAPATNPINYALDFAE